MAEMVRIQIPVGVPPCQVDDFPLRVVEGEEELRARHIEERRNVKAGSEIELRKRHTKEKAELEARPFERSVQGAIHFRPASTKRITEDEWAFLRSAKQHRVFSRRLIKVQVMTAPLKVTPDPAPISEPKPGRSSWKRKKDKDGDE